MNFSYEYTDVSLPYIDVSQITRKTQEKFLRNCESVGTLEFKTTALTPMGAFLMEAKKEGVQRIMSEARLANLNRFKGKDSGNRLIELLPGKVQNVDFLPKGHYSHYFIRFPSLVKPLKFRIICPSGHFLLYVAIGKPASKIHFSAKYYTESFTVDLKDFKQKTPVFLGFQALTMVEKAQISFEFLDRPPSIAVSRISEINSKSLFSEVERIRHARRRFAHDLIKTNIESSKLYSRVKAKTHQDFDEKLEKVRFNANRNFLLTQRAFVSNILRKINRKAEMIKELELKQKSLVFWGFQAAWIFTIQTLTFFQAIKQRLEKAKIENEIDRKRHVAASVVQKKFKAFITIKYANMIRFKETVFASASLHTLRILHRKAKKKARNIIGKVFQFSKPHLNLKLSILKYFKKVLTIQRFYQKKVKKIKEKLRFLRDFWDKTVILMLKEELEESVNRKKGKKNKKPETNKNPRRLKQLQAIPKDLKESTLLSYFRRRTEEHRLKIKSFLAEIHGLNHDQLVLNAFIKRTLSSKRNLIFSASKAKAPTLDEPEIDKMSLPSGRVKALSPPAFDFMPSEPEIRHIIESVLEKVTV